MSDAANDYVPLHRLVVVPLCHPGDLDDASPVDSELPRVAGVRFDAEAGVFRGGGVEHLHRFPVEQVVYGREGVHQLAEAPHQLLRVLAGNRAIKSMWFNSIVRMFRFGKGRDETEGEGG